MARLPNGALLVSKRTEAQVYQVLDELVKSLAHLKRSRYARKFLDGKTRNKLTKDLETMRKLREKFNGE